MTTIRDTILVFGVVLTAACVQRGESTAQGSQGADIVVTATGPKEPVASGGSAEFRIKVANAGPNDATDVRIVDTVGVQSKLVSLTCAAERTAVCPTPLGVSMMVPKLPDGSALDFVVTLKLADAATGTIVNSMAATFDQDRDPNNNSVAIDVLVR